MPNVYSNRLSQISGKQVMLRVNPGETQEDAENRVVAAKPQIYGQAKSLAGAKQSATANPMSGGMKRVEDLAATLNYDPKKAEAAGKFADLGKKLAPDEKAQAMGASSQNLMNTIEMMTNAYGAMQKEEPYPFSKVEPGEMKHLTHPISGSQTLMKWLGKLTGGKWGGRENESIGAYRQMVNSTALDRLNALGGGTGAGSPRLFNIAKSDIPNEYEDYGSYAKQVSQLAHTIASKKATSLGEDYNKGNIQNSINQILEKAIPPEEMATFKGSDLYKGIVGNGEAPTSAPAPVVSGEDAEALSWAKSNPNDPRSVKILQLHGGQ